MKNDVRWTSGKNCRKEA